MRVLLFILVFLIAVPAAAEEKQVCKILSTTCLLTEIVREIDGSDAGRYYHVASLVILLADDSLKQKLLEMRIEENIAEHQQYVVAKTALYLSLGKVDDAFHLIDSNREQGEAYHYGVPREVFVWAIKGGSTDAIKTALQMMHQRNLSFMRGNHIHGDLTDEPEALLIKAYLNQKKLQSAQEVAELAENSPLLVGGPMISNDIRIIFSRYYIASDKSTEHRDICEQLTAGLDPEADLSLLQRLKFILFPTYTYERAVRNLTEAHCSAQYDDIRKEIDLNRLDKSEGLYRRVFILKYGLNSFLEKRGNDLRPSIIVSLCLEMLQEECANKTVDQMIAQFDAYNVLYENGQVPSHLAERWPHLDSAHFAVTQANELTRNLTRIGRKEEAAQFVNKLEITITPNTLNYTLRQIIELYSNMNQTAKLLPYIAELERRDDRGSAWQGYVAIILAHLRSGNVHKGISYYNTIEIPRRWEILRHVVSFLEDEPEKPP